MNVLLGARVFVPIMFLVQFLFFSLCFLSLRIACSTGSGYSFPLCGLFHCGPAIAKRKNVFSQLHVLNRSKPVPEGVHVAGGEVAICPSMRAMQLSFFVARQQRQQRQHFPYMFWLPRVHSFIPFCAWIHFSTPKTFGHLSDRSQKIEIDKALTLEHYTPNKVFISPRSCP